VLRWHRNRYYPIAAQIRAMLPRYRHLSDPEVLAHPFKLSDAQELVARQQGFSSWQALKVGLETMPDQSQQPASKAVIIAAEPELFVSTIKTSLDFFSQKLGFAVVFSYGEPSFYAQVRRDGARLNLRCLAQPVISPERRDREELLAAAMTVATAEDIKRLFLEFKGANVSFFQTLKAQPWGARNFIVQDPDGNLLLFAGPAD